METIFVEHGDDGPGSVFDAVEDVARSAGDVIERHAELVRLDLEQGFARTIRAAALLFFASSFAGVLAAGLWLAGTVALAWTIRESMGTPAATGAVVLLHVGLGLLVLLAQRALRQRA